MVLRIKTIGSWANKLKVCTIDSAADQRVSIGTFGLICWNGTHLWILNNYADPFDGTVKTFSGYTKGIITKVNNGSVDVKMLSRTENATGITSAIDYADSGLNRIFVQVELETSTYWQAFNSVGTATSLEKFRITNDVTVGLGTTVITTNNPDIQTKN